MIKRLDKYIDTKQFRSILCLNGDLPEKDFFMGNLPIIAADGASNKLIAMGIKPAIIVGDLDSTHPDIIRDHLTHHIEDQDSSDYQKALAYQKSQNLLPTIVTGINGGTLDHILNNVNIFLQSESVFYTPPTLGFCINKNEEKSLTLPLSSKISLIGCPHASVSTRGLKWELNKHDLRFPGPNSCFNRSNLPTVDINVHEGALLVIVYFDKIIDAGE